MESVVRKIESIVRKMKSQIFSICNILQWFRENSESLFFVWWQREKASR